jgi:hypothetical protein
MYRINDAKRLLCHYFKVLDTEHKLNSDCYAEIEDIVDDIAEGIKEDILSNMRIK